MPIAESDIQLRLSGGAANSDVNASLGGAKSSVQFVDASLHNLFDVVGSAEASTGDIEYRCIYIHNAHASLTAQNTKVFIPTQPGGDSSFEIALAGEGVNATAETVADESTAPAGEAFSAPANEGAALVIGDIPPGQHMAIWIKRIVTASATAANETAVIRTKFDTAA